MKSKFGKRIVSTFFASSFGQVVTVLNQLLIIPLYFKYWGMDTYGEWLLIIGIPSYFAIAEGGMGAAVANEMSLLVAKNDEFKASQIFYGALKLFRYMALTIIALGLIVSFSLYRWHVITLNSISYYDAALILLSFSLYIIFSFLDGLLSGGYRSSGKNATGIFISNLSRLAELIFWFFSLVNEISPLSSALSILIIKVLFIILQFVLLKVTCGWIFNQKVVADISKVKSLLRPSLGFLAFPLGNAILLQGPLYILSHVAGPGAVAIFSSCRTLTRIPLQIAATFNSSIWPEVSFMYGKGNIPALRKLHRTAIRLVFFLIGLIALLILFFNESLFKYWLHVDNNQTAILLPYLLAISLISGIWNASSVFLAAINQHSGLGHRYVLLSAVGMMLAYVIVPIYGITLLFYILIIIEIFLCMYVFDKTLNLTKDTIFSFLQSIFIGSNAMTSMFKNK